MAPLRLLHETLARSAARDPDKLAIVSGENRISYARLWQTSLALAAALQTQGVRRGDRVAIVLDNTWECAVALYGTLLADAVFVIVNPQTGIEKLAHILHDSNAAALISDARHQRLALPAAAAAPALRVLITTGPFPDAASDFTIVDFAAVLAVSDVREWADSSSLSIDLCSLIYTSGSTGDPKGVMHTHESMLFALQSLVEYQRIDANDRLLCVLPLAFDYGMYQLLMAVHVGGTLVLERSFTYPAQVFRVMREEGVTLFPGVPTIFAMLLSSHAREPLCFEQVRCVTNTAAGLPSSFNTRLKEVFPKADIFRMYGLTECKRVSYLPPQLIDQKPDSVGVAIPGTQVMVLNDDGQPVKPGETGTLFVRGAHVMRGYWNQPDKTAHMLKPGPIPGERMLCTHDLFTVDPDGFLYFVSRTDDVFKSRGEKVSPWEVESGLCGIAGVREAAVLGIPDAILGFAVHAFVSLNDGARLSEGQLRKICTERLDGHMVPKHITILSDLPKSANGKIDKKSLSLVAVSNRS